MILTLRYFQSVLPRIASQKFSTTNVAIISSVLHGALAQRAIANYPLEVNSNSGICTSAATALINAYRAIRTGDHVSAICVGTEHASEILKSTAICPPQDTEMMRRDKTVEYWTNLASVGNTGAASSFIMLDEYLRKHSLRHDDRILLFIPESGQFNFVLISLTAVQADT